MRFFRWVAMMAMAAGIAAAQPLQVPVVLLNGWQFTCPVPSEHTLAAAAGTFGRMAEFLQQDGATVYFFNNCVYRAGGAVPTNDDLATRFAEFLSALGNPDEVDVVAHSMGGLIVRAYLAGQRPNGDFAPPAETRIRKFVTIATPHWGSFQASRVSTPQTDQMRPASSFLWQLNTWLGGSDDLRGADALAIAGNGGTHLGQGRDDGVVSTLSASLRSTTPNVRTRVVPYCHITPSFFSSLGMTCDRFRGIADIDNDAHLTARIVRSFLADTPEWTTLGQSPDEDQFLRNTGGFYVAATAPTGDLLTDLTGATFGSDALLQGSGAHYREFVQGTAAMRATSASRGAIDCGSATAAPGRYLAIACKGTLRIISASRAVAGASIELQGQGFGPSLCGGCAVEIAGGAALTVTSWTDTAITATLPASAGAIVVRVRTPAVSDQIRVLVEPAVPPAARPVISSVVNGASFFAGIQSNSWVTIKGKHLSTTTRIWDPSRDFVGDRLPLALDDVSVTIDGRPAPVYFVSPTQVNVLAPLGAALGNINVVVTNAAGTDTFRATIQDAAPALFTFSPRESRYAAAVRLDGTFLGPTGLYGAALATAPARAGEVILLFGTGCGPTATPVPTDVVFSGAAQLDAAATITIGGQAAPVQFAGMSGNGLCQFNVVVPALAAGDHIVRIAVHGRQSPGGVYLAVSSD